MGWVGVYFDWCISGAVGHRSKEKWQSKNVRIDVSNIIAKEIAAIDGTEDEIMKIMKIIMKIIMFVLKQEFIPFLESFSKIFSEFVNQTNYILFDKTSHHVVKVSIKRNSFIKYAL